MRARQSKFILAFAMLGSCIFIGCQEFRQQFAIRAHRPAYEKWLVEQRPFLGGAPKPAFYAHELSINCTDSGFQPVIGYYLKAGDSAGLLFLDFTIELDKKGNAIGISAEHLIFIRLPKAVTEVD